MRKQVSQKTLANTRKTPQPLKLRGFFIVRWLQFGYFALIVCDTINYFISHLCNKYFFLYISKKSRYLQE